MEEEKNQSEVRHFWRMLSKKVDEAAVEESNVAYLHNNNQP